MSGSTRTLLRVGVCLPVVLLLTMACGLPGLFTSLRDETLQRSVSHGGLERTYRLYLPGAFGDSPGLVVALHGGTGNGKAMERLTLGGLNRLADQDSFIVAYPDGIERHWNDGRGLEQYRAQQEEVDDVGFISALIDALVEEFGVDPERVYVTGISNGGLMAQRLAIEASDKVAAIAVVAVPMSQVLREMPAPQRPLPVLYIMGTDDPLAPWEGGDLGPAGRDSLGKVLSMSETIQYWVTRNGCSGEPNIAWEPDREPEDGTRVRRESHTQCTDDAEVTLYVVEGGGHTWPGGWQYWPEESIGKTSRDIDANAIIWEFFKRHDGSQMW